MTAVQFEQDEEAKDSEFRALALQEQARRIQSGEIVCVANHDVESKSCLPFLIGKVRQTPLLAFGGSFFLNQSASAQLSVALSIDVTTLIIGDWRVTTMKWNKMIRTARSVPFMKQGDVVKNVVQYVPIKSGSAYYKKPTGTSEPEQAFPVYVESIILRDIQLAALPKQPDILQLRAEDSKKIVLVLPREGWFFHHTAPRYHGMLASSRRQRDE